MDRDEKALGKMIRYCKQDVRLLEAAYKKIRAYAPQTVHMGILKNGDRLSCKACGSENTKWDGYRVATKVVYKARRCKDCRHFWRTEIRA